MLDEFLIQVGADRGVLFRGDRARDSAKGPRPHTREIDQFLYFAHPRDS